MIYMSAEAESELLFERLSSAASEIIDRDLRGIPAERIGYEEEFEGSATGLPEIVGKLREALLAANELKSDDPSLRLVDSVKGVRVQDYTGGLFYYSLERHTIGGRINEGVLQERVQGYLLTQARYYTDYSGGTQPVASYIFIPGSDRVMSGDRALRMAPVAQRERRATQILNRISTLIKP